MNGQAAALPHKLTVAKKITKKKVKVKTSTKKNKFSNRKLILKLVLFSILIIALAGLIFTYIRTYQGKIYPKITIAGIKVGGLTIQEANQALEAKIQELNDQGPEIIYNDQSLKPKLEDMGISYNLQEAIENAYQFGRQGQFWQIIAHHYQLLIKAKQIDLVQKIDEEKFNEFLGQLAQVVEKEPVNANLAIKNGEIYLSSAQKGRGLDKEKLKNDLKAIINSGQTQTKIVMETSDLEPTILDDETNDARAQAEKYLATAPITVTFEDSSWTASRSDIGSWIGFGERNGKLIASADPSGFVKWVANQVEIAAKDREIEDGTGTVLNDGQDGRGVDTNTLTAQIKDVLAKSQANASFALITFAIPRGETIIYPHAQPGRFAGRYIDINLSEQTLYAFEDSNLVNQFLVSTGRRGYSTPTGEFHIYSKNRASLMDGPDYYLPNVPWVSWFYGDYSIHGTYWHSNFGHVMSHGCVNASISDAEWLYSWADIGTPVYIHY